MGAFRNFLVASAIGLAILSPACHKNKPVADIAASQLGVREGQAPYANNFWCDDFVVWVYNKAGIKFAYQAGPKELAHLLEPTDDPQRGDIVLIDLTYGSQPGAGITHMGILESFEGENLVIIEGNAEAGEGRSGVVRNVRHPQDGSIIGYRRTPHGV